MRFREGPTIRLLEAQPDLRQGLDAEQAAAATARVVARTVQLRAGDWTPPTVRCDRRDQLALLVIEGILSRTVTLAGRSVVELLGDEDLVRPWDNHDEPTSMPAEVTWTALRPTQLAVLDEGFAARIGRWPAISASLLSRAVDRSRWLARHVAILDQPRLDVRLVLLVLGARRSLGHGRAGRCLGTAAAHPSDARADHPRPTPVRYGGAQRTP